MFTSFIKPVNHLLTQHPGVALAGAFAAVAAPAFLKDEHRGYFRTALVTAPIIAALSLAGPGLVTAASRNARSGYRFSREMPQFFNKNYSTNYKNLRDFVESGGVDLGVLNPSLRNWVDDAAIDFFALADRGAPPIEHSMESAMQVFNRLMPDDGKRTLLTYAVEGARLRTSSPVQLAGTQVPDFLKPMAESDLRGIVAANRADPRFVEEFSRRLRWADRLHDSGAFMSPINTPGTRTVGLGFSEGMQALTAQRPEVAEAIRKAIREGIVDNATIVAEQTTSGEISRLLGVNIKGDKGSLQLPIFDPSTGSVRVGDDWSRLGVGRRIHTPQGIEDLDVFVSRHLSHDWNILKKDIGRAAYFGGIDPENEYKMLTHLESQMSVLSPQAMHIRSRAAIPSGLSLYPGGRTFQEMEPIEKVGYIKSLMGKYGATRIGSEGGTAKGIVEFGESELFTVGGMPSLAKQAPFYRAFSKELQLNPTDIPAGWRPRLTTSAVEAIGGVPEVRMTVAGVSPQLKALFGDLPAQIADLPGYEATAIQRIMNDSGLSPEAATAAWEKIKGKLTAREGYYSAARKMGGLGEGGIILHEKYGMLGMESRSTLSVSQLHLNASDFKDKPFGANQVIGYSGLEPVTSNAPQNFIEDIASANGNILLKLRQRYPVEEGAKVDVAGVKGLVSWLAPHEEFQRVRELMNIYGESTGTGVSIPNFADAISPLHYTQAKVGDPFRTLLEQAAEVSAQVSQAGTSMAQGFEKAGYNLKALDEVNKYMFDLAAQGVQFKPDTSLGVMGVEDSELVRSANRGERVTNLTTRTSEFMEKMSELARAGAPGTEGELFQAFRGSHMSNLLQYMHKNAMVSSAAMWDSTRRNVPQMTSATYDMFSEMFRMGHTGGIKEIMGRLDFQGDPSMASKFAQHFVDQDFTKPLGTVVPIGDAAPAGARLGTMESRVGSVFDPTRKDLQENFSIALKEPVYARVGGADVEVTHVPVLGKGAYGGGSNMFERPGEGLAYSPTELEKKLAEVIRTSNDPTRQSTALSGYFEELYPTLFGKHGFYRAKGVDIEGAVSGFIQTRSTYSNVLQNADPFQMFISEQMARRVRDTKIREQLLAGEELLATAVRHPIQTAPYMKVRVAPEAGLGPNMIGMDERIRGLFGADDDKDILNLFFYRKGTQAEREGLAAVNNLSSAQWKSAKTLEMLYGSAEDSRNVVSAGTKSLQELVMEGVKTSGTATARGEQVAQRMAGATVGAYSNLLTRIQQNIEMHPTIGMNPESRDLLGHLFWSIRQVPISAQKGQMQLGENPLAIWEKINAGLTARSQQGADQVMEAMQMISEGFKNKKIPLTEQSAKIYSEMTGRPGAAAGDMVNAFSDVLNSERTRGLISDFVINRNIAADSAATLLTKNVENMTSDGRYALNAMYKEMGPSAPYVQGLVKERKSGGAVSRVLGAINASTKGAIGELKATGALPILAVGAGLAVGASILTSRLKSPTPAGVAFSQSPGNFRPEDRTSVTDHIPGETMAGSMASVNPPRRQLMSRGGTGTTIVAPMRQHTDLEVRMKSQNRGDTAEIQRLTGQIGGNQGVSNVNVNYRNGWRNKMSTLRQRDTIREQLEG